jgi:hypothetical protein
MLASQAVVQYTVSMTKNPNIANYPGLPVIWWAVSPFITQPNS